MRMFGLRIFYAGKSRFVPLEDAALTVGSAPENDVVLDDPALPALPAFALSLTLSGAGYSVRPAHPKIRPLVNGAAGDGVVLKPGDRLELGSFVMILETRESADRPEGASAPDSLT